MMNSRNVKKGRIYIEPRLTNPNPETLHRFSYNTPKTKEAYYFRVIFDELFGQIAEKTVRSWTPPEEWGCAQDPSGRAQVDHLDAYHKDDDTC